VPGLATYTGKSCVYIRQIDEKGTLYIGYASYLPDRYGVPELKQVIYFEEYADDATCLLREAELLKEFTMAGLPLANRFIPRGTLYQSLPLSVKESLLYTQR
jgi:hypothetical protein